MDRRSYVSMVTGTPTLVAFRVVAASDRRSRAAVRISQGPCGYVDAEAEGEGSMDAIFRAAEAALGVRGKVTALRIYAFADCGAVGKARIRVDFAGREYAGRGWSSDAVEAAARAYLSAAAAYLAQQESKSSVG
jgi:2-isopropylmalate synthase